MWPVVGVKPWPEHTRQGAPGGQADSPGGHRLAAGSRASASALEKDTGEAGGGPGEEVSPSKAERGPGGRRGLPTGRGALSQTAAMALGIRRPGFEAGPAVSSV